MKLVGTNVDLAPLTIKDAYEMRSWGLHESILFRDYNFPYINDVEVKNWFRFKTLSWRNKYYSVRDKSGKLIGYMGMKNKRFFKRTAFLGIVFDPEFIGNGLGTEAMELFLSYYFNELRMRAMRLEVAEFNERAIHVYEKLGFKKTAYYLDVFPDQKVDTANPEFIRWKSCFVIDDEKIYNYIYEMKLTKDVYISGKRS